jgi:FKBP-type peptidyl-prolyl cis-trans isomerase
MKYIISLLLLVSFISCNNEDSTTNLKQTEADIIQYIDDHNLDAQRSSAGVYYVIDTPGDDVYPTSDAYVKISYKGYLLDGSVFDSSTEEGISFDLLNVIPGFADGIKFFSTGSKGTILIPPSLAYGNAGIKNVVPGGAVVIFDVEVISIMNPQSEADIINYLDDNNLTAERTNTGLYYHIENQGDGAEITSNSLVVVKYKGTFINGVEFDASSATGANFDISNLIPGFAEGLQLFNVGGKGTLYIPPSLAYGSEGISGKIPRNAVLIFEIEILSAVN